MRYAVPAFQTFGRNYVNKEGECIGRDVFQSVWEEVFQYGKYGGHNSNGGEWIDDPDALDSLFRDHDKTYDWAEKMLKKGEIKPSQEHLMKTQADIQLLAGLTQYDASADPTCKYPVRAQRYQFLAMTIFGPIRGR